MYMCRCGEVHYVDASGKERVYETVERTTRTQLTGIDGVDVISTSAANPLPSFYLGAGEGKGYGTWYL